MRTIIAAALAATLTFCFMLPSAFGQDQGAGKAVPEQGGGQTGQSVIGIGDANFDPNQPIKKDMVLSISVSSKAGPEDALTGVFPVDASGAIQMKLAGRIEIKDLTPQQAAVKIAAALASFVKESKVNVAIISVPRTVVFMSGSVTKPGAVAVSSGVTLGEVLTVYGYAETADLSKVRILHRDEKGARTLKEYDFTRWLKPLPGETPDEANNPVLSDRDMVFVPSRTNPATGVISVEGDVAKPSQVPLRSGVSTRLREALSMAGGANPTADRRINIRRLGVSNAITVDYDKMEAGDPLHDIEMRADDVVYVEKLSYELFVNLIGGFTKVGRMPYQRAMTLTQAVGDAGGTLPFSKEKEGHIFRHPGGSSDPTKTQVIAFNLRKIRDNKENDLLLLPGDTVEVQAGSPPRPPIDPLQLTASLLTIALLIDRLGSNRSSGF